MTCAFVIKVALVSPFLAEELLFILSLLFYEVVPVFDFFRTCFGNILKLVEDYILYDL